jgi:lactate 2-monooxygenase
MSPQPPATQPSSHRAKEDGVAYEQRIYERGLDFERPALTFQSDKWEELACERLSADSKGYVYGSAGTHETRDKNISAFKKWSIAPQRLVKYDGLPDLSTNIFGEDLVAPIALAPVGVLKIFNAEGEIAVTKAAAAQAVPHILSTASSTSIEDVAEANGQDGLRWYQLYWPSRAHDDITISLLNRAQKAGYSALFVTLDTYILGWRPQDMDNGYNPFLRADRIGVELGMTDPVFRAQFKEKHGVEVEEKMGEAAPEFMKTIFPGENHTWEDVKFLQEHWKGPIVLKGIQTISDAKKAVDAGVQGIVVSNHGGRQTDGGNSSLGVLPHIVDAVHEYLATKKSGQDFKIFFDSGIRAGADIAKALALGADCVLLGRPFVYGLALGGQQGVEHVLKSMVGELELTLHLSGIGSVRKEHLNRGCLIREETLFENVKGVGLH